jgi:peptidoglycan biosynthesis protein MviN/MurJ (putative lipid II flippase)
MPTSLLLGVVQAALLGAKDSVTPLISILYSTIVNVVGDFLLVKQANMGLQGAAIATVAAQLAATAALLGPARKRLVRDHSLGLWRKPKTTSEDSVSGKAFLGFAAPVLTLILGKLAAFGFMTHSAGKDLELRPWIQNVFSKASDTDDFLSKLSSCRSWSTHTVGVTSNRFITLFLR